MHKRSRLGPDRVFLKFLRSQLNWVAFIGDPTSGPIVVARFINHHKGNDWLDSEVIKVN